MKNSRKIDIKYDLKNKDLNQRELSVLFLKNFHPFKHHCFQELTMFFQYSKFENFKPMNQHILANK